MIQFKVEESSLVVSISGSYPVSTYTWNAPIQCSSKAYALLLQENFNTAMQNKLENIRKEAYNQGWKNAKAKTFKNKWFSCLW